MRVSMVQTSLGVQVAAVAIARDPRASSRRTLLMDQECDLTYQLVLRSRVLLLCLGEVLLVLVIVGLVGLDNLLLALGGVCRGGCCNVGHGRVNSGGGVDGEVARPEDLWRVEDRRVSTVGI
jgi:hypothetical protein